MEIKNKEQEKGVNISSAIAPGLVTGASDNDPAGIATYALAGIRTGYGQLWLLPVITPMLIAVQSMAARIASITKRGIAANIVKFYGRKTALLAVGSLVIANVLTIGADIAAMAQSMSLLIPGTTILFWVVPVSFIMWYVLVFFNYREIRLYFLWLILISFAFVVSAYLAKPDWSEVLRQTINPVLHFTPEYIMGGLALVGTTISPYLLFWEAQETLEEKTDSRLARFQNIIQAPGFILSNFVSFMIIVVSGTLLFNTTAGDVTAVQIAKSLEPLAGPHATTLFALGILGAGFLAVPVLAASAAAGISELLGWRKGLSLNVSQAKGFYEVITLAMLIGVQIAIANIDPIKALFVSQIIAGMLCPIIIFLMLRVANNKRIMGSDVNSWFDNIFGGLTVLLMTAGSLAVFWMLFS